MDELPLIDVAVPHDERAVRLVAAFREQSGRAPEGMGTYINDTSPEEKAAELRAALDRSIRR